MKNFYLLFFISNFLSLKSFSQNEFNLEDVTFQIGYNSISGRNTFKGSDLGKFYPTYNFNEFTDNNVYDDDILYIDGGIFFNMEASKKINFLKDKKSLWKFGFQFCSSNFDMSGRDGALVGEVGRETIIDFDIDGMQYEYDLVKYVNNDLSFNSKTFTLDNQIVLRTNPAKKVTFYYGLSLQTGLISYNAKGIYYDYYAEAEVGGVPEDNPEEYGTGFANLPLISGSTFFSSVNIPFGLDFRVGSRVEALRHWHLFMEFKPGVAFVRFPQIKSFRAYQNGYIKLIGFRYVFDTFIVK